MQDEALRKKIMYYTMGYFTPFVYLIVLVVLFFDTDLSSNKDALTVFLIWGIPAVFSLISSIFIINRILENNVPFNKGVIRLSLPHIPMVLGFLGAIIYLFY